MFSLITLSEAKSHLRVDVDDGSTDPSDVKINADVQLKLDAACAIIMNYLKLSSLPDAWNEPAGSPAGTGVPPLVKSATMLVLGELYRNREAPTADVLSTAVKAMLERYRDPTLA